MKPLSHNICNLKKVLTLVLTVAMLLSVMVVGTGAAFSDQDSIKNKEAVDVCTTLNIIAGMEDGSYDLGGQTVKVSGNLAVLEDGTIAGSVTNLMDCLRTAVKDMDIPLESAVKCAAANPIKAIGLWIDYGSLTRGKYANLALLDETLALKQVIHRGVSVY